VFGQRETLGIVVTVQQAAQPVGRNVGIDSRFDADDEEPI
jgi:hypothetical protein